MWLNLLLPGSLDVSNELHRLSSANNIQGISTKKHYINKLIVYSIQNDKAVVKQTFKFRKKFSTVGKSFLNFVKL